MKIDPFFSPSEKEKVKVNFRESDGRRFYYADIGKEFHGKVSFRLWVSERFVKKGDKEEYIEFPIFDAAVVRTEKGNFVLRPSEGKRVEYVLVRCYERGRSEVTIISPSCAERVDFWVFESPRGTLGKSQGCLVTLPKEEVLLCEWRKGMRCTDPSEYGVTKIYPDGKVEVIDGVGSGEQFEELTQL